MTKEQVLTKLLTECLYRAQGHIGDSSDVAESVKEKIKDFHRYYIIILHDGSDGKHTPEICTFFVVGSAPSIKEFKKEIKPLFSDAKIRILSMDNNWHGPTVLPVQFVNELEKYEL